MPHERFGINQYPGLIEAWALVKLGAIEKELHREELDTLIFGTRESDYGA